MFRSRLVYFALAAAWAAFAWWLYRDYVAKVAAERASLRAQGEAILVALESSIGALSRFQDRRGDQPRDSWYAELRDRRIEQLKASLDELVQNPYPPIFAVSILDSGGESIVSSGDMERWNIELAGSNDENWLDGALLLTRTVDTSRSEWIRPGKRSFFMEPLLRPFRGMEDRERRRSRHPDFWKNLGLTADQEKKYGEIQKSFAANLQAAKSEGERAALFSQMQQDFQSILTEEQAKKLEAMMVDEEGAGEDRQSRPEERGRSSSPVYARLVLSQGELASIIQHHAHMALLAGMVGLVAAVFLGVAWHSSIKNREQVAALEVAEAQNLHLREMQLAGAGLAHEMKNPLNIVRGTAQGMLQNGNKPAKERQALERMLDEIDRVVSRLNEFLSFSRMPKPEFSPVSVRQVVDQVSSLLHHGMEAENPKIAVSELPTILADRRLFRQIVFNLLHNGVRATEEAGSVRVYAAATGPTTVRLEVSDSGTGVPEGMRDSLFRPYCTGWSGGTGLGLCIVRQLALAHGWKVGYRPSQDGGSTFWISGIELFKGEDEAKTQEKTPSGR